MSEWWTYSLSDFLMFSLRTYYRQFELLNRELWPLHVLALGMGAVITACMLRVRPGGRKLAFGLIGLAWVWVAWSYHLERYADIHTGGPYFAAAFCVQAALMTWLALRPHAAVHMDGVAARAAPLIALIALLAYPLLAPLTSRSLWQAEVFAIAPDPTVAATLGALLFWRAPWFAWLIPVLWSATSGATLLTLRAPQPWLLPSLALLALALNIAAVRRGLRN